MGSLVKFHGRRCIEPDDGLPRLEELLREAGEPVPQEKIDNMINDLPVRIGRVLTTQGVFLRNEYNVRA